MLRNLVVPIILLVGGVARADGGFSVGVEGGMMQFDSRAALDATGMSWGLRGGIGFLGPTRLEARYFTADHDLNGFSEKVREGNAQLRLSFIPGGGMTPYAFGGFGMRVIDSNMPGARPSDSVFVVPLGAGLDLPLADYLKLAPEFTWHHLLNATTDPGTPGSGEDTWSLALVLRLEV